LDREDFYPDQPMPKGDGEPPTKICPQCEAEVHAAAIICPECNFVFPPKERDSIVNEELVELAKAASNALRSEYQKLMRTAFENNWKLGYAALMFKKQFGRYPKKGEKFQALFEGDPEMTRTLLDYLQEYDKPENVKMNFKAEYGFEPTEENIIEYDKQYERKKTTV
jgi:hypothetical protein